MTLPIQITRLKHRRELGPALIEMGLNGIGVEVGVNLGTYSDILLKTSKLSHLFSVDPWLRNGQELSQLNYLTACAKLAMHRTRVSLLRMYSNQAATFFQDNTLDLVFIDANHSRENVSNDINLWWPKVRKDGILAGHDYWVNRPDNCQWNDVKFVVDAFSKTYGIDLHTSPDDPKIDNRSWYTVKI